MTPKQQQQQQLGDPSGMKTVTGTNGGMSDTETEQQHREIGSPTAAPGSGDGVEVHDGLDHPES
ncbi:hypothetical protein INR49_020815 [Caranx melampygus]|nr:hypothetical protein INR49_020815 [Caranx melampygus]